MLFFFYGTLMKAELLQAVVEGAGVRLVGEGTVAGTLYDLGAYPGMVLKGAGAVPGVLFEVHDTATARLDAYEEVADGLYRRCRVRVERMEAPTSTEAWAYEYLGSVDSRRPIDRWPRH